jgi:mycothiol synthase
MAAFPTIPGYTTRAVRLEDAPDIADMLNREVRQWAGEGNISAAGYAHDITGPDMNPELDTAVVLDGAGRPAAVADVYTSAPFVRAHCFVRVAPEHLGRSIGTQLTRWALARARERSAAAPTGERVTATASARSTNEAAAALLAAEGFTPVRSFFRMDITLDGPPPAPVWPEGIGVRAMTPGADERALYRMIEDAFRDHWGHVDTPEEEGFTEWRHYLTGSPGYDPETVFLAVTPEGGIAGAAVCLAPEEVGRPAHIWQLGVRRPWRKQGLGRALLLHAFGAFQRRGVERVALGVDADSPTGATRLYESAGMTVQHRNDVYELELRPGDPAQ